MVVLHVTLVCMSSKFRFPARPRSRAGRIEAAHAICERLKECYPEAHCALNFTTPFELLVATVLSAQTTDARVNSVTPRLFSTFPSVQAMADASRQELEEILHPLGFFRSKAKNVQALSRALLVDFDSQVPRTLEELITLPGVGRKTANVVLGNAFDTPGITVDTHMGRLARRWGWSREEDPVKVEKDIAALVPEEEWTMMCHRAIAHGRAVCHSRSPECATCPLADLCPSYDIYISGGRLPHGK